MKFGQDNKYKVIVHNTTYLSVLEILKMVMLVLIPMMKIIKKNWVIETVNQFGLSLISFLPKKR